MDKDLFQLGVSNNLYELFQPKDWDIDTNTLMKYLGRFEGLGGVDLEEKLQKFGLGDLRAKVKVASDPRVLNQLNYDKLPKWGITRDIEVKYDALKQKKIDRMTLDLTILAQFEDISSDKFQDLTIIPIEAKIEFFAGFRPGIGTIQGPS